MPIGTSSRGAIRRSFALRWQETRRPERPAGATRGGYETGLAPVLALDTRQPSRRTQENREDSMPRVIFPAFFILAFVSLGWTLGAGGAATALQPEPKVLLHETFDQNDGGWKEQQTSWMRSEVTDGKLFISSNRELQQYLLRDVGLSPTGDFDIECTVETRRGNPVDPIGLVWGYTNTARFLEYLIWMDGHFLISRNGSPRTEDLVEITESPDLNTGFAVNTLKLSRRGERLLFFINGRQQGEIPFTMAVGPRVGFVIWNEVRAYFDDLIVTQY